VRELNKKVLVIAVALMAVAMLATPMVSAKPATEKNNDKFEYFHLLVTGYNDGTYERAWYTPPNVDPLENKTEHTRGAGWWTWPSPELTVGDETFDWTTAPYSIDWTTTVSSNVVRFDDGTVKHTIIKLTDVVTVYDEGVEIGTLVLKLKSAIREGSYSGNIVGYGTGALEGVHISAIDLGLTFLDLTTTPPTLIFEREGTITGWPEQITNMP
jgi:hypothetical protein